MPGDQRDPSGSASPSPPRRQFRVVRQDPSLRGVALKLVLGAGGIGVILAIVGAAIMLTADDHFSAGLEVMVLGFLFAGCCLLGAAGFRFSFRSAAGDVSAENVVVKAAVEGSTGDADVQQPGEDESAA